MDKPKKLYRGIVLQYSEALNGGYLDGSLFTKTEAQMDNVGHYIVSDGNEYGLYMTDNPFMAQDVYGNPEGHTYERVNQEKKDNGFKIGAPAVGIVYEIDTSNIEVKNPELYAPFQENNGFGGKEWISKSSIDENDYHVIKIKISEDVFNGPESITVASQSNQDLYSIVSNILINRRKGLDIAAQVLDNLPRPIRCNQYLMKRYFTLLAPYLKADGKFFISPQKNDSSNELERIKDKLINHYISKSLKDPTFSISIILSVDGAFSSKNKDVDEIIKYLEFRYSKTTDSETQNKIEILLSDLEKINGTKVEI